MELVVMDIGVEGVGRQYVRLRWKCPSCGAAHDHCMDKNPDPLSPPTLVLGSVVMYGLYCAECDWEGSIKLKVKVVVELAEEEDAVPSGKQVV